VPSHVVGRSTCEGAHHRCIFSTSVCCGPFFMDLLFKAPREMDTRKRDFRHSQSAQQGTLLLFRSSSNSPSILLGKKEEHVVICESALPRRLASHNRARRSHQAEDTAVLNINKSLSTPASAICRTFIPNSSFHSARIIGSASDHWHSSTHALWQMGRRDHQEVYSATQLL
jgi:hypothetical protein